MFLCYILFSPTLNRYYVGHCEAPLEQRLKKHLANHKGFTGKAKDWAAVHVETFDSKEAAYARERYIKAQKSRAYIESLCA